MNYSRATNWWHARSRAAAPSAPTIQDDHPWQHPYLGAENIARFRAYSEDVWSCALDHAGANQKNLRCAFAVNMAQNMYKWARLARAYGAESTLFLHPHDNYAISLPQWEEFDGEFRQLSDGPGFISANPSIVPGVPTRTPRMAGNDLFAAWQSLRPFSKKSVMKIALRLRLILEVPSVRHSALMAFPGFYPYYEWTKELSRFDVIYAASAPFAAYACGKPYCVFSVGGDLQYDCCRNDSFGEAMRLAFSSARFLFVSNPHTLGHSRRLGLRNGIYLPYPMDTNRYCPGKGEARKKWEAEFGAGLYLLTTARLDKGVKGHGAEFLAMVAALVRSRPNLRFIFLGWGHSANEFQGRITAEGLQRQVIVLNPVGKIRLIDYYRSCDVVLDQFVYGYYGVTALEAASVGKPVVMKIRAEQYAPLYAGDVAPVMNASTLDEIAQAIIALVDDEHLRAERGEAMRNWVVRNHGEEKTTPMMLALLQLAADRVPLPRDLVSPLCDPETDEEAAYHQSCLRPAS